MLGGKAVLLRTVGNLGEAHRRFTEHDISPFPRAIAHVYVCVEGWIIGILKALYGEDSLNCLNKEKRNILLWFELSVFTAFELQFCVARVLKATTLGEVNLPSLKKPHQFFPSARGRSDGLLPLPVHFFALGLPVDDQKWDRCQESRYYFKIYG